MARAVEVVEVVRLVEVIRVVEVVYRYEENLGVKGPNKENKNKDVGLPMTMPQAAGKNLENQPKTCFTTPVCQACITSNLCKTFDIASNRFSKCFLESQILHIITLVDKL